MSGIETDRRTMLALLAAGLLPPRLGAAEKPLLFLNAAEYDLVQNLAELILPADEHSPGAKEADVGRYIDLVLANSDRSAQAVWKRQMTAFQASRGGELVERVKLLAPRAGDPGTPAERFFARVREMTIFAYYTSRIGLVKELGYKGNQALAAFPGCPEHKSG